MRAQVLGPGVQRREEGEDQVDRLVVDGVERHRLVEAHEDPAHTFQPFQPGVRRSYPVPDARRTGLFALG